MGIFLGKVEKYNKTKGHITIKLNEPIEIGDTISLEKETGNYTVSELMDKDKNINSTKIGQTITIGRMKGNISIRDKVYKMSSKSLLLNAKNSYQKEFRKIALQCDITIKKDLPISILVTSINEHISENTLNIYKNLKVECSLNEIPLEAKNKPLDAVTIIKQISKTNSTPYVFEKINIDLDENLFIPKLSILNELRRTILEKVENYALEQINRNKKNTENSNTNPKLDDTISSMRTYMKSNSNINNIKNKKLTLLLNNLNENFDYSNLEKVDNLYIPLKYFSNKKYKEILKLLAKKYDLYIYMPTITKENYTNLFYNILEKSVADYTIKGFVVSNIGTINLLRTLFDDLDKHFKLIANYTFNVFNSNTVLSLKNLDISKFTISPELDKKTIEILCDYNYIQKELIVYGRTPLMNMSYCLLGNSNKCYPNCKTTCKSENKYLLKDRLNICFLVVPDNSQTITTIYNSKITSIASNDFFVDCIRIDILDETIEEINHIIINSKNNTRLEGKDYTNGNLYRNI